MNFCSTVCLPIWQLKLKSSLMNLLLVHPTQIQASGILVGVFGWRGGLVRIMDNPRMKNSC